METQTHTLEFFTRKLPTYLTLTLEFYSTLRVERKKGYPTKATFRLGNHEWEMSTNQFNEAFMTPNNDDGTLWERRDHYREIRFWELISSTPEIPLVKIDSHTKASFIRNPALRYMHRILAHTLFARVETGSLGREELYILWCMYSGLYFDVGAYFLQKCDFIIGRPLINSIFNGGLITQIANFLGIDTSDMILCEAEPDLDVNACISMNILRRFGPQLCLEQKDNVFFPLPNTKLTTLLGDESNLSLSGIAHQAAYSTFLLYHRIGTRVGGNMQGGQALDEEEPTEEEPTEESDEPSHAPPIHQRGAWSLSQQEWASHVSRDERMDRRMANLERDVNELKLDVKTILKESRDFFLSHEPSSSRGNTRDSSDSH